MHVPFKCDFSKYFINKKTNPGKLTKQNRTKQNKTKQVICFVELDTSSNQQASDVVVDETSAIFQDYFDDAYLGLFL